MYLFDYRILKNELILVDGRIPFLPRIGEQIYLGCNGVYVK